MAWRFLIDVSFKLIRVGDGIVLFDMSSISILSIVFVESDDFECSITEKAL